MSLDCREGAEKQLKLNSHILFETFGGFCWRYQRDRDWPEIVGAVQEIG
jgi:hypothetical protein